MARVSDYRIPRDRMVQTLARKGVRDQRVLEAMRSVPRHLFVPDHLGKQAYGDHALPIGEDQTISQPFVVARMTELLQLSPEHSVLEIGSGSGYQTAILGRLAARVYSLERIPELGRQAVSRIRELGLENVKIQVFDGTVGWSDVAPFDRILVTAGAPSVPPPLLEQLASPGRLLLPEGDLKSQQLILYDKTDAGIERRVSDAVVFVPLIGRHGWKPQE
jgi:protein-L-isoaspartate(D-aspartate) O-methyltransferase